MILHWDGKDEEEMLGMLSGKFLRIDLVVNGSNPPSARLSLRVRRIASSL